MEVAWKKEEWKKGKVAVRCNPKLKLTSIQIEAFIFL